MDILFHDQGYKYFYPLEPKSTDTTTIRLQSSEKLKAAYLILKECGSGQIEEIEVFFEKQDMISRFLLYKCIIPPKGVPYRYCFKAETETGRVIYLNIFGESEEMNLDSGFYVIPDFSTPDWSKGAFWYSVLPNAFYNGNVLNDRTGEIEAVPFGGGACHPYGSRYGGDLEGVAKKLDYIRDMGVNAVYLNPLWVCKDAGGYGPEDFDMLDPAYCNDWQLCDFLEKAHKKDLKVMLDAVVVFSTTHSNLCNQEAEWPITGALQDETSEFCDYFSFKKWPDEYHNYFASLLFDFNKELVKDYLYKTPDSHLQRYLRAPYRIDGWRFDSSELLWGKGLNEREIAADIKKYLKEINLEMLFLAENYHDMDSGIWETCWNMHHLFNLREWMLKKYDIKFFLWKMRMSLNERSRPLALSMYTHFDNHDVRRLYPQVEKKERLLAGIICQMTYLGSPTLFYGDETGDKNLDIGYYHSFNWNIGDWDLDFYRLYKVLGAIRRENAVFKKGIVRVGMMDNERELLSYGRFDENGAVVTVLNPNEKVYALKIPVDIYEIRDGDILTDIISGEKYTVTDGCVLADINGGGGVLVKALSEHFQLLSNISYPPLLAIDGTIAPECDWSYLAKISANAGNALIFAGENKENAIYLSSNVRGKRHQLQFGRIVNGKKIPYFDKNICKSDMGLQIQRVGTRYSAFYHTNDNGWMLLGENLFASFSVTGVWTEGNILKSGFGNAVFGGEQLHVPIAISGFDGDFEALNDVSDILRLQCVDSPENYRYVNGGMEREDDDSFGCMLYHKPLSEFRINASLLPHKGEGRCGIIFGADEKAQGGYRLSMDADGNYELNCDKKTLARGTVCLNCFGADFIVEVYNRCIVIYNGGKPIIFERVGKLEGYAGYFADHMAYRLLSFMACDLRQGLTKQNIIWNIKGNTASIDGTGLLSPKGIAYSNFKASVKIKIVDETKKQGLAGILTAASESYLSKDDGLFFAVSSDGCFVVKHKDTVYCNLLIAEKREEYFLSVECVNGRYSCSLDGENMVKFCFEKWGGAVSVCSVNAKCEFAAFKILPFASLG